MYFQRLQRNNQVQILPHYILINVGILLFITFILWLSVLNFLFKMKVDSMVLILLFGFYMEVQSSWTPYPVEDYDYKCHR